MGEERQNIACLLSKVRVNHIHVCALTCVCIHACTQIGKCTYDMKANGELLEGSFRIEWLFIWVLLWFDHCLLCLCSSSSGMGMFSLYRCMLKCVTWFVIYKGSHFRNYSSLRRNLGLHCWGQLNIILFKVPSSSGSFLFQWGCCYGGQVKNGQY